jgi:hypothetical protein
VLLEAGAKQLDQGRSRLSAIANTVITIAVITIAVITITVITITVIGLAGCCYHLDFAGYFGKK